MRRAYRRWIRPRFEVTPRGIVHSAITERSPPALSTISPASGGIDAILRGAANRAPALVPATIISFPPSNHDPVTYENTVSPRSSYKNPTPVTRCETL